MSQWASQPCWEKSYFKRGIKDGRSLRKTSNRWCMWRVWIQAETSPSGARTKRLKVWLTIHLQFIIHSDNVKKWQFSHRASIYPTDPSPSTTGDIQSVNTAHLHHTVYVSLSLSVTHCCETLWTFQQRLVFQQPPRLRTTVRMSQMSFFFTRRDSWMAHSLSVKTRARHEVTSRLWSMKSGKIKKRERGREKFNFHASLMLILTIKHSHVCSSRPNHRGELFLAFPICHIWHLCFNNSYIDYV